MKSLHYLWHTTREPNLGYLLLRLFVGVALLTHGWPKLTGGAETWRNLGGIMGSLGIPGPAVFWGFMAAFAEGVAPPRRHIACLLRRAGEDLSSWPQVQTAWGQYIGQTMAPVIQRLSGGEPITMPT